MSSYYVEDESGGQITDESGTVVYSEPQAVDVLGSGMLDIAISIYSPSGGEILVEDVITAASGLGTPIYSLTYEDTPDGCGAGSLNVGLYYEQFYDLGYWSFLNLVEISSGDNVLAAATAATNSGTLKCYLDTNWTFDPARGEDSQLAYINDGVHKTMMLPVQSVGFDNAPSVVNRASALTAGATSVATSISTPTAGNRLIAIVTFTAGTSLTAPSGFSQLGQSSNTTGIAVYSKIASGSETSVSVGFGASIAASIVVLEVANGGTPTLTFGSAQAGPSVLGPTVTPSAVGSLLVGAFAIANGSTLISPYGWQNAVSPNSAAGTNALTVAYTPATDTNPYTPVGGWTQCVTAGAMSAVLAIPPANGLTPLPWITVGMPGRGGGIPGYGQGAIVGRRRYIGQIVKRTKPNQKLPDGAVVTLAGLQNALQGAIGTFLVANSAAKDVGTLCFNALAQFATSHFPFLNIPAAGSSAALVNFPPTGSTYSGNNSKIAVDQFLAYVVAAIVNGDQWNLRIGHDSTPRLVKLYDGATGQYIYNVSLNQSAWSFAALGVEITDEDTSSLYNAVEVMGNSDSSTGVNVSAIVLNTTQIAALGYQIDGSPQSNNALLTVAECAAAAQALLTENSAPASSQKCTVFTHDDVVVSSAAPGGLQRGDVVRGVANLTVTGFPGDAPPVSGLVQSVVTTLDFQKMESQQDASFQAIVPDYIAIAREIANGYATAAAANAPAGVGLDQYFVGQNAFAWTISGFLVTAPQFEAVFALGSNPVQVGGTSFTLTPSANNYVWLNPSGSWTVKVNDVSPVTGAIPYAEFWTDATSVCGSQPRAQTGLLGIPASYFYEGSLLTPTITGSPTFTISPGRQVSQIAVQFEASNQPTDGSFSKMIGYYRQSGQATWLQLATSPPRNATVGSDGNGAQLTGGAVSATGIYTFVLPEAANDVTFEFGFAYQSLRGSESTVLSLGTATKSSGVPSMFGFSTLRLGSPTETIQSSGPTTLTVQFSVPYTISGITDFSWVDHIEIRTALYDPGVSLPPQLAEAIYGTVTASGTLSFSLLLTANSTTAPTFRFNIFVVLVSVDGGSTLVFAPSFTYTHA